MAKFKNIALLFAVQILLTAGSVRGEMAHIGWLSEICFLGMLTVPFIGYIVVLYRAPTHFLHHPWGASLF